MKRLLHELLRDCPQLRRSSRRTAAAAEVDDFLNDKPEDENELSNKFVDEYFFICGAGITIATRGLLAAGFANTEPTLGAGGVSVIPYKAPVYKSFVGYCLLFSKFT